MSEQEMKLCTGCGEVKLATEFSWRDTAHTKRSGWCRPCVKQASHESRQLNIERYRSVNRAWNDRHPDKVAESRRKYRETHSDELKEYARRYRVEVRKPNHLSAQQIDRWLEGGQLEETA